jgi:hypothetical protein
VVSESEASDALARVLTGGRETPIGSRPTTFRHSKPERPFADDLRRTLRQFREEDPAWFLPAIELCRLAIDGRIDRLDEARGIASALGEQAHFEGALLPMMSALAFRGDGL